jgi:ATP-dependent DNA helicase RecG
MRKFKDKEFSVLISTTVIEVGIDIPSATVMIIQHADRFWLSALHQLRGRAGRSSKRFYLYLCWQL